MIAQRYTKQLINLLLVLSAQIALTAAADDTDTIERPFLTRDLVIFGVRTPITPTTIIIFTTSALILYNAFTKQSSAVASHILIDDDSEATQQKLIKMKNEINNDKQKFAEYAGKHSTCPSGKSAGGSLGKFKMGAMVPPFDKAVFSPKNEVGVVIGPLQTQFGWHLILIQERDEQRQLVIE
jgi:peptidyl-prolyl cis-trans isomerase C